MQTLINTNTENLYSFDIFDTLITRKTATPAGIFYLMQELLKNNTNYSLYLRENFKDIRIQTESFVREVFARTKKWNDITFDDIYKRIQINYSLTDDETDFLKKLELKCEIENLIPIEENLNKLKKLISSGNQVILISDMYHSEKTLRHILTNLDPIFNNIKIFISSEYKKTKAHGDLYRHIKTELNPQKWEHCGDNICADFSNAKKNNISPYLYNYIKFKKYEQEALKNDNLTTEYVIGTAKNLRLNSNSEKYNFGASFAGPILYQYVNWILENALKTGIEHLYFIARDGYLPKLIADIIIKEKNLPLKTHYIYGSRKAWRLPTENTVDEFITFIFNEYINKLSGKFISKRLGISYSEYEKFTNTKCDKELIKGKKRKEIFENLINNKNFKNWLVEKYKNKYLLVQKYLQQEIDFSKPNFAFIDLNGSGRTQDILKSIISDFYDGEIKTFYFCTELNLTEYEKSIKKVFMCTSKYRHYWIELLCRNIDGQTIDYKEENGTIKPVFEKVSPQKLLNWGYNEYIAGILDFTKTLISTNTCALENNAFYFAYFSFIMNDIDKETADILGSIPYSDVGNEKLTKECAPKYNIISLIKALSNIENDLIFISKGRCSKLVQSIINIKIKYKSFRKFIIDVHIHKKKMEAYICIMGKIIDLHIYGYKE